MDWATALVLWTPVSVALLALFLLVLLVVAILAYGNRIVIVTWFRARWVETSTAHARTVAISTTSAWLIGEAGIPGVEPVSFTLVKAGWLAALAMFIKSDATPNPSAAGPSA